MQYKSVILKLVAGSNASAAGIGGIPAAGASDCNFSILQPLMELKYFVLIDELFKGTNIQDAMKCSSAVIEGLQNLRNSLFIISTHLYEISDGLKGFDNIQFSYFETAVKEKELIFHYQLKNGVSQDRLGYLILEREGVVDLLKNISKNKY